MDGGMLGGLVAVGLAGLALLASFSADPSADPGVRTIRIIGRAFIAGIGVLGLVVTVEAWFLDSQVDGLLGVALGILMGVGAFGILVTLRSVAPDASERGRRIVRMAFAEALSVLACIGLLLAIFASVPA